MTGTVTFRINLGLDDLIAFDVDALNDYAEEYYRELCGDASVMLSDIRYAIVGSVTAADGSEPLVMIGVNAQASLDWHRIRD